MPETVSRAEEEDAMVQMGEDIILKVPEGTVIKEASTGKVIVDMSFGHEREIVLKGGRGGKGNMNYATPTMQVPKYAQPGKPAEGA